MLGKIIIAAAALLAGAVHATAQDYPTKPIRIEVGFAAGGGTDLLARIIAEEMGERLGQRVIVENKPGASGALAGGSVARAAPDGYTLWLATQGPLAVAPLIQKPKPYDPIADFQPVTLLTTISLLFAVNDSFPAPDFKSFVAKIKDEPGKNAYATAGLGGPGHLAAELFLREAGLQMQHIPYAGDGAAIPDVLSGVVPIWVTSPSSAGQHIASKKVRALAVTDSARVKSLPDTPTVQELGYADFSAVSYNALLAPKGTPQPILDKLMETVADIYQDPDAIARIEKLGYVPRTATPQETADFIKADNDKWDDIVLSVQSQLK